MRLRDLKIGQKLLLINLVSILLVVIFAGGFWALRTVDSYRDYFEQRISSQAAMVASNSSAAVMFDDAEEIAIILNALAIDEAILSANITQYSSGRVQSVVFRDDIEYYQGASLLLNGNTYGIKLLEVPIVVGTIEVAKLGVVYHDLSIQTALHRATFTLFIVCVLSLIVAALLSFRLQVWVTKPIFELTKLMRKVTETENYSLRIPFYFPDEIGALTKDFNTMLSIIELRDQSLELQVQRRSSELAERNKQLEQQIHQREDADKERLISEAGFEQVFQSAPIGMALLDASRLIMRSNIEFQSTLGLGSKNRVFFDDCLRKDDVENLRQTFTRVVCGEISNFQQELDCYGLNGQHLRAVIHCSAVRDDVQQFRYAVLQLQDITESRKLAASLEYQASHDALTGLANRWVLNQALEDAFKEGNTTIHTLCVLDLDQFKVVNDTAGHVVGDELLMQIAGVIQAETKNGLVARLGGDEFAMLLLDCDVKEAAVQTETVRLAIERVEFYWDDQRFKIGASIGAVSTAKLKGDISGLMQQADTACFMAKDQGRNRTHIIDGDDSEVLQYQGEMRWLQRIDDAIENNHFELFVQPITRLNNGAGLGPHYEVLLRLNEPDNENYILPGIFLHAAERYGLSAKIDRWVVRQLLATLTEEPQLLDSGEEYWINLSAVSLGDTQFLEFLEATIAASPLSKGVINFEITETAVMRNIADARLAIGRLKALGCRFALDDFGKGTASFDYLKQLPVDIVKIDGSFVKNIVTDRVDYIFVKSIVDIAREMNIQTVAEYVETEGVFNEIVALNTDYAQGYYLGMPQPLKDLF